MRAPGFWQHGGWQADLLSPLELLTARLTARRMARAGWTANVPVICAGNATVGGSGKTPLCLDILARLRGRGVDAHALTRGHGGAARMVTRADPARHAAADIGDEALLLAGAAPCWVGADRAASARAAIAAGARALVMDDGLQNPTLRKDFSFLTIDGGAGFGNHRLLPAGPLREPVETAAARCRAAVLIGSDFTGVIDALPHTLPVLRAHMQPGPAMQALAGKPVLAFAGIGRPAKFFSTLAQAGISPLAEISFADHHRYTARDLDRLRARAAGAALVTTTKDFARIPPAGRQGITPLDAALAWDNAAMFDALLKHLVP
jgi:tetraacyldisaccharide 4'-kinase